MNIYITFFLIWFFSWIVWVFILFLNDFLIKKVIGIIAIIFVFLSGIIIAPAVFYYWKTDSFFKDSVYLFFVFSPLFFMGKILAKSLKKPSTVKHPLKKRLSFSLSDRQKIFIGLTLVAVVMLIVALSDNGKVSGFYMFLRIIVSASLVGLLLERFPAWCRLIFVLALILYNPLFPIHLDDRYAWCCYNFLTLPLLIVPQIVILKRAKTKGAKP